MPFSGWYVYRLSIEMALTLPLPAPVVRKSRHCGQFAGSVDTPVITSNLSEKKKVWKSTSNGRRRGNLQAITVRAAANFT